MQQPEISIHPLIGRLQRNGCSPYHNGNIIAEEIPPELLSYMEEVLPEKKELDTEIVLDTMINVNEFLKN